MLVGTLEKAETLSFSLRAAALEQGEFTVDSFTMKGFQDLHFYVFRDIYPFAGEFRDVQLIKGNTRFCQVQFLESYTIDLFLKRLPREQSPGSLFARV